MKTKLLLTTLLSFVFCLLSSQIPQGFNYQAIARDGSGQVIANTSLPVKIAIQTSSTGGTVIWEEQHSSVTSNQFGLISFVVGTGTKLSGTAATFSAIDWNAQILYLKTTIQYPGTTWTTMGTTQIWSVPYSLVAKDVEGPITKLGITGTTSSLEEALFEVKNKDGQTIFAVYNEGVRVYVADGKKGAKGGFAVGGFGTAKAESQKFLYVDADSIRAYIYDDPSVKASKGGFAVGGFNLLKNQTDEYMLISPDSIRMYIDDTGGKAAKGGFAVGGFNTGKGESAHYLDVATDASGIINPSENRVLWYPLKNALLTGKVLIEKPDSVGENSFASGYESKAVGDWSQALGYKTVARGDYSTAIGKNAVAGKLNSFALGENAFANNNQTYAFGNNSQANALGSFAFGYNAKATGQDAFAFGSGTEAIGQGSIAFGFIGRDSAGIATGNTKAEGITSVAIGMGAQAKWPGAVSIGTQTISNGYYTIALGYKTNATGYYTTAVGNGTKASGSVSTAMGFGSTASGSYSTAFGTHSTASGAASTAFGWGSYAKAEGSVAMGGSVAEGIYSLAAGEESTATGNFSTAIGFRVTAQAYSAFVAGAYNYISGNKTSWVDSDPLFVIGNGNNSQRKNALTNLKNGNVGIGIQSPLRTLHLTSSTVSNEFIMEVYDGLANWKKWNFLVNGGTGNAQNFNLRILNDAGTASSKDVMTWFNNGNVGIGTANPAYKLDIASGSLGTAAGNTSLLQRLYGYSSNQDQLRIFQRRFSSGTDWTSSEIRIQKTVDVTDMGYISFAANHLEFGIGGTSYMTLTSIGYLGIGTSTANYPLSVGSANSMWCSYGYLNSAGNVGTSSGTNYYSIFAENRIRAEEFNADSDERIKDIIGTSDKEKDLEILKKINVTDFRYIDSISKGNVIHKKVIAQEIRDVYPNAVASTTGYIPSIYSQPVSCVYDQGKSLMIITLGKDHGLQKGDNVKFIDAQGIWIARVADVVNPSVFSVQSDKDRGKLFVYGKEVDDFLTVDYEAISMLNVSATQELISNMEEQEHKIESQQKQIDELMAIVSSLASKNE